MAANGKFLSSGNGVGQGDGWGCPARGPGAGEPRASQTALIPG